MSVVAVIAIPSGADNVTVPVGAAAVNAAVEKLMSDCSASKVIGLFDPLVELVKVVVATRDKGEELDKVETNKEEAEETEKAEVAFKVIAVTALKSASAALNEADLAVAVIIGEIQF